MLFFQEELACDEVVDADDGSHDDLCDTIVYAQYIHACEHEDIIEPESYDGQHDKYCEFFFTAHSLTSFENKTHRSEVVENESHDEACCCRDKIIDTEYLGESQHRAVVDEKRYHTDNAELGELLGDLLDKGHLLCHRNIFSL